MDSRISLADLLKAFLVDRRASLPLQYALIAAASGLATVVAVRAVGNDVAAQFEAINAALTKAGSSGALLH
jgi:Flp pilus assembly pilin Flp